MKTKHVLLLLIWLMAVTVKAQFNATLYRSKVTDSTTVTTIGFGVLYYNNQSHKWRAFQNGIWYDLIRPSGGLSSSLASGKIYLGNVSNVATAVTPSGDATISNTGVFTVGGIQTKTLPSLTAGYLHYNGGAFVYDTPSGTIGGLTTNRIPYATNSTTLGDDSALSWDATNNVLTVDAGHLIFNTANTNTFVGNSGNLTVSGTTNVGVGTSNLTALTSGAANVAVGDQALAGATTGSSNIAVGKRALTSVTTTNANVAIGHLAGEITTGHDNTFIGWEAGQNNTTGSNNVVVGSAISVPGATTSNQLSIQNAIFGTSNSATGTTVSTGGIGIYQKIPAYNLHVTGNVNNSSLFLVEEDGGTNIIEATEISGTTRLGFFAATPVVKQSAVTSTQDIANILNNYGLIPSSTISSSILSGTNPSTTYTDAGNTVTYYTESNLHTGVSFGSWSQAVSLPTNVPNNSTIFVDVVVMGIQSSGTVGAKGYSIKMTTAVRKNNSGTYTQIGTTSTSFSVIDSPDSITSNSLSVIGSTVLVAASISTAVSYNYTFNIRFSTGQ